MIRRPPLFCIPLLALLLAGCAAGRSDVLTVQSGGTAASDADLIIVTVDNGNSASPPRPASTRPGYGGTGYVASDVARKAMRDLSKEYVAYNAEYTS